MIINIAVGIGCRYIDVIGVDFDVDGDCECDNFDDDSESNIIVKGVMLI